MEPLSASPDWPGHPASPEAEPGAAGPSSEVGTLERAWHLTRDGHTESTQGHRKVWDVCRMNVSSDSHRDVSTALGSWTWRFQRQEASAPMSHAPNPFPCLRLPSLPTSPHTPRGPSRAGQRLLLLFAGGLQPLHPTLPIAPEHKTEGGTQS